MLSLLKTLTEHRSVGAVAFSIDGSKFATGGAYRDNSIRVWDRRTLEPVARLRGHKKRITSLAFARDASTLVSSSADRTVAVWDLARAQLVASHGAHKKIVNHVACGGMQQLLVASGGQDGMLCLWEHGSGVPPRSIAAHGSINGVAFSPDGTAIVTGGGIERGDFAVQVRDLRSDRVIQTLTGHSDWPLWVGFSHRGDLLASGSYGEICIWDARSWRPLTVLRRPDSLRCSTIAFSFTSYPGTFVSGGWAHEEETVEVRDASGSIVGWNSTRKGLAQLWDLETGQLRDSFPAHDDALTCLAASPTEGILVTAGKDGVTKAWTLCDD